ncbi:MAG: sigma-70 family RNA polymerase sigma factor [Acidobacteriota bacterium]
MCTPDPDGSPGRAMNPESTYLQQVDSIERIAAFVARRGRLNADETVEFVQIARVKLFEDDYAIIRKFEGRSSLSTYLTTVILRLFHQWRVEQWGKWRPSAEAKRLGGKAVLLERMLTRDGYTFDEAVKVLTMRSGAEYTVEELEAIYLRLPVRSPRPSLVSDEVSAAAMAVDGDADDRLELRDRERTARQAAESIDKALLTLDAEDRLILQMRFWDCKKVPDIARILRLDQKKLYKRLDKLFALLRRALETAGVSKREVEQLLCRGDQEIRLGILPGPQDPPAPSPEDEDESQGGEGAQ